MLTACLGLILMDTGSWLAPTVISSAIAGAVALATHFSSQSTKKLETREDIRSEAFDQAKTFYVDVIDRQEHEIAQLREQVNEALVRAVEADRSAKLARERAQTADASAAQARGRAQVAEQLADRVHAEVRQLRDDLADRDARIQVLTELHP